MIDKVRLGIFLQIEVFCVVRFFLWVFRLVFIVIFRIFLLYDFFLHLFFLFFCWVNFSLYLSVGFFIFNFFLFNFYFRWINFLFRIFQFRARGKIFLLFYGLKVSFLNNFSLRHTLHLNHVGHRDMVVLVRVIWIIEEVIRTISVCRRVELPDIHSLFYLYRTYTALVLFNLILYSEYFSVF